jgi:hypothetical protein
MSTTRMTGFAEPVYSSPMIRPRMFKAPKLEAFFTVALFLIAMLSITTETSAQNAYKCGNTYSAVPCAGGIAIDTQDNRTSAQKSQSESATAKTAKAGDAMEKARLAHERADARTRMETMGAGVTVMPAQNAGGEVLESPSKVDAKKKKNAPEFFTAQAHGEKAEKAAKVKKVKKATDASGNTKPKAQKAGSQAKDANGKS